MNSQHRFQWPVVLFFLVVMIVLPGAAWAAPAEKPTKVTIGFMMVPNPLTVAKELGWIEQSLGRPVEWVKFASGRHVLDAIDGKAVDLMHIGSTPCARGIAKGLPIEVVWVSAVIAEGEALVVRKDAGIETLHDLQGLKVATPFESTSHYALKAALKLSGIQGARVDIVNMDPSEMIAAWDKNEIQAGYVWNPVLSSMVEKGGSILLTSKEMALRGFPTAELFVARKDFAEQFPGVVSGVVRELNRAAELCRSAPEKASAAVARGLGISAAQAQHQMKKMIFLTAAEQKVGLYIGKLHWEFGLYTLLKDAADFLEAEGAIETSPPWPAFRRSINPGFLEEIYRQIKRPKY